MTAIKLTDRRRTCYRNTPTDTTLATHYLRIAATQARLLKNDGLASELQAAARRVTAQRN